MFYARHTLVLYDSDDDGDDNDNDAGWYRLHQKRLIALIESCSSESPPPAEVTRKIHRRATGERTRAFGNFCLITALRRAIMRLLHSDRNL